MECLCIVFMFLFHLSNYLSSTKEYDGDEVVNITSQNVNEHLSGTQFSMVLFYAPWQKECKETVRLMSLIASKYYKNKNEVLIGKADIYNDRKLASKFHIEDYCLIKYFVKGSKVAESYEGNRTEKDVIDFISHYSKIELMEKDFRTKLIKLNEETFKRIVKDKTRTVLVLFHTEWCTKCTKLLQIMRNVARVFQKEPQCVFGQIDGEKNYKISIEEHVGVYPTFVFYPKDNKDGETYLPGKYDERWSEKNITKFMNAYCQANFNENVIEEKMIGRMDEMDLLTKHFVQNRNRRQSIIRETILKIQMLKPAQQHTADFYVETMRQVFTLGDAFLDQEVERLDKLSLRMPKDADEISKKRNILQHFRLHRRDEL